jgi:hypothetical protein
MEKIAVSYLSKLHRLAERQVYFGVTNTLLTGLSSTNGQAALFAEQFPVIEWKTNMQTLIGEGVLVKLLTSDLKYLLVRIDCNRAIFQSGGRLESEQWLCFLAQLQEHELAKQKCKVTFAFDRGSGCDQTLIDRIVDLRDNIYPIGLSIECQHRSWHSPSALQALRKAKLNIVQREMPLLSGFYFDLPNFDSKFCLLRLSGRNSTNWFSKDPAEKYHYDYNRYELAELAGRIKQLREECDEVYVIAANRPHTAALSNLLELASIYFKA